MPRGGSKKGEHRGNAKPREGLETPSEAIRRAVKQVRKAAIPKQGKGGNSGPRLSVNERDILIAQIQHGRRDARDLTPKEVMLDNMAFFQNIAYMSKAMAQYVTETEGPTQKRFDEVRRLEIEEERCRRIASDEARNVAPYIHPRLAAYAASGNINTSGNIVKMMLEEIDRRAREAPMIIEHIPNKRTA